MAGVWKAQVELEPVSGKREDVYVNTWHFLSDPDVADDQTQAERIRDIVRDFYVTPTASAPSAIGSFIAPAVTRAVASRINITRRPADYLQPDGGEVWGSPDFGYTLNLPGAVAQGLPSQIAAVVSFHASYASLPEEQGAIRPRARRRGKVYIGPLVKDAIGAGGQQQGVLFIVDALREAATRLLNASTGAFDYMHWATYSRTLHEAHRVVGGHVDNSPDVQRRRKTDAFDRQTFGA